MCRLLFFVFVVFSLISCGGGGDGDDSDTDTGPSTHKISGTVTGITSSLSLHNNGSDEILITEDGGFTFPVGLYSNSSYLVSVLTQPAGQFCVVNNRGGEVTGSNVTDIFVECFTEDADTLKTAWISDGPNSPLGFVTEASNGERLIVFGEKDADGNLISITAVRWISETGETIEVRIGDNNLPTVILIDGTTIAFNNYTATTVDLTITLSDGNISQVLNSPLDTDLISQLQSLTISSNTSISALVSAVSISLNPDVREAIKTAMTIVSAGTCIASGGALTPACAAAAGSVIDYIANDSLNPEYQLIVDALGAAECFVLLSCGDTLTDLVFDIFTEDADITPPKLVFVEPDPTDTTFATISPIGSYFPAVRAWDWKSELEVGTIAGVNLYLDLTLIAQITQPFSTEFQDNTCEGSTCYFFNHGIELSQLSQGLHILEAQAVDAAGNVSNTVGASFNIGQPLATLDSTYSEDTGAAEISLSIPPEASVSQYILRLERTGEPTVDVTIDSTATSHTYNGLEPNKIYYVTVLPADEAGSIIDDNVTEGVNRIPVPTIDQTGTHPFITTSAMPTSAPHLQDGLCLIDYRTEPDYMEADVDALGKQGEEIVDNSLSGSTETQLLTFQDDYVFGHAGRWLTTDNGDTIIDFQTVVDNALMWPDGSLLENARAYSYSSNGTGTASIGPNFVLEDYTPSNPGFRARFSTEHITDMNPITGEIKTVSKQYNLNTCVATHYYEKIFTAHNQGYLHGVSIRIDDEIDPSPYQVTLYEYGLRHGNDINYYPDGQVQSLTPYVQAIRDGLAKRFYQSGVLELEDPYVNDIRHGTQKAYHDITGSHLSLERPFVDGKVIGTVIGYFQSGQLYHETPYIYSEELGYSLMHGLSTTYYDNAANNVSRESPFVNNNVVGIEKTYHESSLIDVETPYIYSEVLGYSVMDGTVISYYDIAGSPIANEAPYDEGHIQGTLKAYYTSGNKYITTPYEYSVAEGYSLIQGDLTNYYDAAGNPVRSTVPHLDDEPHGTATNYYQNGVVSSTYVYVAGELNGAYRDYNSDTRINTSGQYTNSQQSGTWTYYSYDEDGNVATTTETF